MSGRVSGQPVVTATNYPANLVAMWSLADLVAEGPLEEMIAAAERAEDDGAALITSPVVYRDACRAIHEDLEMLRALRHVQLTIESIKRRRAGR